MSVHAQLAIVQSSFPDHWQTPILFESINRTVIEQILATYIAVNNDMYRWCCKASAHIAFWMPTNILRFDVLDAKVRWSKRGSRFTYLDLDGRQYIYYI